MIDVSSAGRLLREKWKDATQLAQELYSMITAQAPAEIENPVTITQTGSAPALKIVRSSAAEPLPFAAPAGNSFVNSRALQFTTPPQISTEETTQQIQGSSPQPRRSAAAEFAQGEFKGIKFGPQGQYSNPAFEVDAPAVFKGPPAQFSRTPEVFNPFTGKYEKLLPPGPLTQNLSTQTIFYGVVASGSGDTYQVKLWRPDPNGALDTDTTTVQVPMIAADEQIESGTTIGPITRIGSTYWCQVPVWVS